MAMILIIEDNPTNMKLAALLLESAGHATMGVGDAEAGLALARSERPDLILMDIQLPGMDGLAAASLLKADPQTRDIPIIALTALAMSGDAQRIVAAGCDAYVAKPLVYREFLSVVHTHLPHPSSIPGADPWPQS